MDFPPTVARHAVPGLKESELEALERSTGKRLPGDYREFLRRSDGLSLDGGLLIYGSADLTERNETWEVDEYAPGHIAIADDGGGDVLILKLNGDDQAVYAVESCVMDPEFAHKVSESLAAWIVTGLEMNGLHLSDRTSTTPKKISRRALAPVETTLVYTTRIKKHIWLNTQKTSPIKNRQIL